MRTWKSIGVALVVIVLLFLGFVRAKRWWNIDKCLDAGGRWDDAVSACDFGAQGPPKLLR